MGGVAVLRVEEREGYHMYGDPWREQRFSE
jgi:DMSO/TMAO reductase YedYZ molybdopterin-dependent catalytic subunit